MDETQGIAQVSEQPAGCKAPRPARPWFELLLCVVGSLGTLWFPSIGTALMVYGAWLLSRKEEGRTWLALAGCLVPGIALSFVSWDLGSLVLPCSACALAIALLLPGRVSVSSVCLVIVGTTAAMILADASLVMLWGETFAAYVDALLAEMRELTVASLGGESAGSAVMASVDRTIELFGKIWPLIYAMRAAGVVLVGLLGLVLARRNTYASVYTAFTRFDAPLWAVAALVAGIACLAWDLMGFAGADVAEAVGLNVLFCLRVVFFLQGLAVAMYLMEKHRWSSFPRVLAMAAMLMAELGLCAVCVYGVIDVWANFRGLPRDRAQQVAETHGEGE